MPTIRLSSAVGVRCQTRAPERSVQAPATKDLAQPSTCAPRCRNRRRVHHDRVGGALRTAAAPHIAQEPIAAACALDSSRAGLTTLVQAAGEPNLARWTLAATSYQLSLSLASVGLDLTGETQAEKDASVTWSFIWFSVGIGALLAALLDSLCRDERNPLRAWFDASSAALAQPNRSAGSQVVRTWPRSLQAIFDRVLGPRVVSASALAVLTLLAIVSVLFVFAALRASHGRLLDSAALSLASGALSCLVICGGKERPHWAAVGLGLLVIGTLVILAATPLLLLFARDLLRFGLGQHDGFTVPPFLTPLARLSSAAMAPSLLAALIAELLIVSGIRLVLRYGSNGGVLAGVATAVTFAPVVLTAGYVDLASLPSDLTESLGASTRVPIDFFQRTLPLFGAMNVSGAIVVTALGIAYVALLSGTVPPQLWNLIGDSHGALRRQLLLVLATIALAAGAMASAG